MALVSAVLLLGYLLFTGVVYSWRMYFEMQVDSSSNKPLPPGTMGFPVVGETLDFVMKGCKFYTDKFTNHGRIYKTHIMGSPTIRLIGTENIKKVLTGENHIVQSLWPKSVRTLLGSGSLASQSGQKLKDRKTIMLKAIGPDALRFLVPEIQRVITNSINDWCKEKVVLGHAKCTEMTYKLAAKVIFGIDIDQSNEMIGDFETLVDNLFCLPIKCPGLGFKKATDSRVKIIAGIRKLLALSKNRTSGEDTCVLDVLASMCETEESLPEDDLIDMLIELLFAGHHTTASACCSLLLHLGQHEDIRNKIADDLIENDVMMASSEPDLTYDQICKLSYVDQVTKEILRMKPPVGGGFRKALKTFEVGKYQVPKDWTVIYSIRETHSSTPLFKDHEEFQPERWEDESLNVPDLRFHYLPFGVGARSCPGEKLAKLTLNLFIIELIRRCKWHLHCSTPEIILLPSPHPKDKLPVTFTLLDAQSPPQS